MPAPTSATPDPWDFLKQRTQARIALGRAGGSLPTREWLTFSADHAAARDAVHSALDLGRLEADVAELKLLTIRVGTPIADRQSYLQRPDLGGRLDDASRELLAKHAPTSCDLALIIADGLSALAAQLHAPTLLGHLLPLLQKSNITLAPLVLATHARVALQDDIGQTLHAKAALILIGERPGLGAADSLGAYLVFSPNRSNTNANRNCVSNIRPAGLPPEHAAHTLHYLLTESLRRKLSGVALKDERPGRMLPGA